MARLRRVLLELEPPVERSGLLLTDSRACYAYDLLRSGDALGALVELGFGERVEVDAAAADALGSLLAGGVLWCVEPEVWGVWSEAWERACARRPIRHAVFWSFEVAAQAGASPHEIARLVSAWSGKDGE